MNHVYLTGRLVKETELLGEAKNYLRNTVAVTKAFKNDNGEYEVDFINFVAFGRTAELIAGYLKKGDFIILKGRISTSQIETKQGYKMTVNDIVADNIEFVPRKKETTNNYTSSPYAPSQDRAKANELKNPFENVETQIEINEDDLPF